MALRKRYQEHLASLDISTEEYFVDMNYVPEKDISHPAVWGLALIRDGEDICVVESTSDNTRRFTLRTERTREEGGVRAVGMGLIEKNTQRECLAEAVRRFV